MANLDRVVRVVCSTCRQPWNCHRILYEDTAYLKDHPDGPPHTKLFHRFLQCMGCGSYKYGASKEYLLGDPDDFASEYDVQVYPDSQFSQLFRSPKFDSNRNEIPANVFRIYRETLMAINAHAPTLAAGGLRALVEAICKEHGLRSGNLQEKIDGLAVKGFLARPQVELLHEERYLGNKALHELEVPSDEAIEDGLEIVEGLINAIYVLPEKAKRLRALRGGPD